MKPFIKDGSGNLSWTATILLSYVVFYYACYGIGFFCPEQIASYAQLSWDAINVGLFGVLATYVGRRGTEVYERVKNGKKASVSDMMEVIGDVGKDVMKDKEVEEDE